MKVPEPSYHAPSMWSSPEGVFCLTSGSENNRGDPILFGSPLDIFYEVGAVQVDVLGVFPC
jgi:hypothetical protein